MTRNQPAPPGSPSPNPVSAAAAVFLPWSLVAKLMVGGVPPIIVAALIDPMMVLGVMAGLGVSMGGAIMGSKRIDLLAVAAGLIVFGIALLGIDLRLLTLILAALAGWEAARPGGRAFVMSFYGAIILGMGMGYGAQPVSLAIGYVGAAVWGFGLVAWMGIARIAAPLPEGDANGLRLALFLALGVLISLALIGDSSEPRSTWLLFIFVMRALSPVDAVPMRTLYYCLGAILGGSAALGLEYAGPPGLWLSMAIATGATAIGLRMSPLLSPMPAACFTLAVLIYAAPQPEWALIRMETVLVVGLLTLLLSEGLRLLIDKPGAKRL